MADRYPEDYGRDSSRGRFSRSERWGDEDDWRRARRQGGRLESQNEDDDDRRGAGAYGGAYGQSSSSDFGGGYARSRREWDEDFDRDGYGGGYGQGGMRGQSYGAGYRDREEYDRAHGLQGSSYGQQAQSQYGGQGGYSQDSQYGRSRSGYRQQGVAGFGAYEEGGSLSQGRPGMGAQGYERTNQDYGGYSGAFGQGGNFGPLGGFGSEQSGGYLTRGGRTQWGRHRGRGPKNYTRSDDRIREDVNDRLTDDPHIDASEIDVKVTSCEVTLTGTVDSREAKRRAEDCVESVSGVKNVQNNLRVQRASGEEETTRGGPGKKNKSGGDGEQRIQ
jgi:hypothetical protein